MEKNLVIRLIWSAIAIDFFFIAALVYNAVFSTHEQGMTQIFAYVGVLLWIAGILPIAISRNSVCVTLSGVIAGMPAMYVMLSLITRGMRQVLSLIIQDW